MDITDIFKTVTQVANPYALVAFAFACGVAVVYVWFKWGKYATERKAMSQAKGESLVKLAYAFGKKYDLPTDRLKAKDVVLLVQQHVNSQEKRSFRLLVAATLVIIVLAILGFLIAQQKSDPGPDSKPFTPIRYEGKGINPDPDNNKYNTVVNYRAKRQEDAERIVGALQQAGYINWKAVESTLDEVFAPQTMKIPGATLIKTTALARENANDMTKFVKLAIPQNAFFVNLFPDDSTFQRNVDIQIDLF